MNPWLAPNTALVLYTVSATWFSCQLHGILAETRSCSSPTPAARSPPALNRLLSLRHFSLFNIHVSVKLCFSRAGPDLSRAVRKIHAPGPSYPTHEWCKLFAVTSQPNLTPQYIHYNPPYTVRLYPSATSDIPQIYLIHFNITFPH